MTLREKVLKSPERGINFPSKYYFWVLTTDARKRIMQERKGQGKLHISLADTALHTLFPLRPYKLRRNVIEMHVRRIKTSLIIWRTKRLLGKYPFRARCGGGCRFHLHPAVCFPFKRLCWEHIDRKRPFANPVQMTFAEDLLPPFAG